MPRRTEPVKLGHYRLIGFFAAVTVAVVGIAFILTCSWWADWQRRWADRLIAELRPFLPWFVGDVPKLVASLDVEVIGMGNLEAALNALAIAMESAACPCETCATRHALS